jgi:hypothetical protein
MVPSTRGLQRYPVNDIVHPTECTLMIHFGRQSRKKEVARGIALPLKAAPCTTIGQIPPDYARVDVSWTHDDLEDDEIDIPRGIGTSEVFSAI